MTSQISFVKCVTQLQHGRKSLLTKSSSIYLSTKCTARSHFIQECTPPAVFPQPGQAQAPSTLHEKMKDLRIIISLSAIIGTSTIVYSLPISVSALSFPLRRPRRGRLVTTQPSHIQLSAPLASSLHSATTQSA